MRNDPHFCELMLRVMNFLFFFFFRTTEWGTNCVETEGPLLATPTRKDIKKGKKERPISGGEAKLKAGEYTVEGRLYLSLQC